MNHNDPMPYSWYAGPRDGSPSHIRAIVDYQEHLREDAAMAKELEDAEQRVWEAREEEDARAYLSQKPIMLNSCKED